MGQRFPKRHFWYDPFDERYYGMTKKIPKFIPPLFIMTIV